MEITKHSLEQWLTDNYHTRDWLAEQLTIRCGTNVSRRTVDNWLRSPRPIPKSKLPHIAALMQDDQDRAMSRGDSQVITLRFDDEHFDAIEQAALRARKTVRQWATDSLNEMAQLTTEEIIERVREQQSRAWEAKHDPRVLANIRQQLDQMARDDNDKQAAN